MYSKFLDESVIVSVNSPWEYERASGGYEDYFLKCLEKLKVAVEKQVFYEIGSSNSILSLFLAKKIGGNDIKVLCFEPEPQNIATTNRNIQKNGLNNILLLPVSLSDVDGHGKLYLDSKITSAGQGGHSLETLNIRENKYFTNVVKLKLDTAIDLFALPKPNFVSVDVEGHEINVIMGMKHLLTSKERTAGMIVIEIDKERNPRGTEVDKVMSNMGYKLYDYKSSRIGVRPHSLACFIAQETFL